MPLEFALKLILASYRDAGGDREDSDEVASRAGDEQVHPLVSEETPERDWISKTVQQDSALLRVSFGIAIRSKAKSFHCDTMVSDSGMRWQTFNLRTAFLNTWCSIFFYRVKC